MLKEVPAVKLTSRIKVYDEFATFLSINRSHCKQIIETIVSEDISDYIWNFYLGDVSDNYLARPDEYTYKRNFIHTPFWFSTLYTKIGVLPPPTVRTLSIMCMFLKTETLMYREIMPLEE